MLKRRAILPAIPKLASVLDECTAALAIHDESMHCPGYTVIMTKCPFLANTNTCQTCHQATSRFI